MALRVPIVISLNDDMKGPIMTAKFTYKMTKCLELAVAVLRLSQMQCRYGTVSSCSVGLFDELKIDMDESSRRLKKKKIFVKALVSILVLVRWSQLRAKANNSLIPVLSESRCWPVL